MVRKIGSYIVAIVLFVTCFASQTHAATYEVYETGNLSTTYITYFKDIISNQSMLSDYVAFRSGQYTYTLAVGDLDFDGDFYGNGKIKIYEFDTESSGYGSNLTYAVTNDSNFELLTSNTILYSNLGDYPNLIERGANIETIQTILLGILMCSIVINRVFRKC